MNIIKGLFRQGTLNWPNPGGMDSCAVALRAIQVPEPPYDALIHTQGYARAVTNLMRSRILNVRTILSRQMERINEERVVAQAGAQAQRAGAQAQQAQQAAIAQAAALAFQQGQDAA